MRLLLAPGLSMGVIRLQLVSCRVSAAHVTLGNDVRGFPPTNKVTVVVSMVGARKAAHRSGLGGRKATQIASRVSVAVRLCAAGLGARKAA